MTTKKDFRELQEHFFINNKFHTKGLIYEYGIGKGRPGRHLILSDLPQKSPFIWIYGHQHLTVYPPSWAAKGVKLENAYFIKAQHPIKELRPLFTSNAFSTIVIDSPKTITIAEMAFIKNQARLLNKSILIIRPFFLSIKQGNPYATHRINIFYDDQSQSFRVDVIKGKKRPERILASESSID